MYVGEEITLLYNPTYPTRLDVKGTKYWLFGILCGMGVIFLLVGSVYPVIMIIKSIKKKNLLRNGMALSATVEEIRWDTSLTVMGRHPYVIICSYHDPGKDVTYRFKSEGVWTNPDGYHWTSYEHLRQCLPEYLQLWYLLYGNKSVRILHSTP